MGDPLTIPVNPPLTPTPVGLKVWDLCRKRGFTEPSYYAWNKTRDLSAIMGALSRRRARSGAWLR